MRIRHAAPLLAPLLLALAAACSEPTIPPERARPFVEAWAAELGDSVREGAASAATSAAIEEELARARDKDEALLALVYAERDHKAGFVVDGALTERGRAVRELIASAGSDGYDAKEFDVASIDAKLGELKELSGRLAEVGEIEAGQAARDFATAEVTARPDDGSFTLDESSYAALNEAFLADDAADAIRAKVERYEAIGREMASAQAGAELALATGLARYARKTRYHKMRDMFVHELHFDRYNDVPELRAKRPPEAKAKMRAADVWRGAIRTARAIGEKKLVPIMRAKIADVVRRALSADDPAPVLAAASLGPQYDALKKEHARYRAIAQAGGWPEVEPENRLKKGFKSETARALKERLKIEGLYPADAPIDDAFDDALAEAIAAYKRTHQMDEEDTKLDKSFWRSLNTSAEARADQIERNLKRWRASNVRHYDDDAYVLVNIPDFHAEIYKDQERVMRMRVVVGNNDRSRDEETGQMVRANRTPTVSAYIDRVIYNPYWVVTPRIREEETLVDVRKDLEKRYQAKVDRVLGIPKAAAPPKPVATSAGPTGVLAVPAAPPRPAVAPPYRTTSGGWMLDIPAFERAYAARTGAAPGTKSMFPYVVPETGLVDVSTTDPNNVPPWYAANGYEVMYPGNQKWEHVRQKNGPGNALGKVKVIFPNMHDIYLHDTPAKALFGRTIRAFSHGCMRMHEPLDFAAWLLENDGRTDLDIDKIIASRDYNPIYLTKKVPVHVEYFTVRADDDGRAVFLIDIYDRDDAS